MTDKNEKKIESNEKNEALNEEEYLQIISDLYFILSREQKLRSNIEKKLFTKISVDTSKSVMLRQTLDVLSKHLLTLTNKLVSVEEKLFDDEKPKHPVLESLESQIETLEIEKKMLREHLEKLEEGLSNREIAIQVLEEWIKTFEAERQRMIDDIVEFREKVEQWQSLLEYTEVVASSDKRYHILKILAMTKEPMPKSQIKAYVPGSAIEIENAIQDLINNNLVILDEKNNLILTDPSKAEWLIAP